jgi:HlyD family secretion protein
LASDQASIDADKASLIKAQQNLSDAQLTSPISGTVAQVNLSVGQSVTAGSTSDVITIMNSGSFQATATLTPAQASTVKVGDMAEVTVTGTKGTLEATVARVGPVDTSSSSYTYPLVVALPAGTHGISAGSAAEITVVLAQAKHVEVVPTSAVHSAGGGSYVDVVKTGQEQRVTVEIGVVGADYTQIKSGLSPKTELVLADLSEAVPSSSSSSTSSSSLLGGGGIPSGGGFPAGARFPSAG